MCSKRLLCGLTIWTLAAWAQRPVISSVANAASYSTYAFPAGSIASIFGSNLAASTLPATAVPLPTSLGGTSVAVNAVAAPLFYVSPSQINFQVPSYGAGTAAASGVVVTTAAGRSDPYPLGGGDSVGLFTLDASGCGRGAVSNVSAYGTGLGIVNNPPPDGSPAPSSPLAWASIGVAGVYDFVQDASEPDWWDGRAPGLIGVDQLNVRVPETTREGCAVPFQVVTDTISQPVTLAVRNGGGPCVDPPTAGYGKITWEKTVSTTAANVVTEADTVTVSLQASPGKQAPPVPVFSEGPLPGSAVYFGPSCPVPGYRSLGAGTVTVQGPGFAPITTSVAPLQQQQVTGLTVYQAALPTGTIQSGNFTVAAGGGPDVGGFQSSIQIGSEIQITSDLAGIVFCNQPVT